MAAIAIGRHGGEFAQRAILVACVAIHRRMRSQQREPVVMLLDLLDLDVPALHRVAFLAICSELPLMNVGVALRTLPSNIGKHRLGVALHAGHALVHSAQGEARRVVIKFWNRADRFPALQRMAVLAGNIERAVRAPGCGRRLRLTRRCPLRHRGYREQHMEQ